jgi:hypothetical protein
MATILSDEQAIKIVKEKPNSNVIARGLIYESRLRLYTEVLQKDEIQQEYAYSELLQSMANTLHKDKYQSTLKFISYPLPIVNITRDISADLERVFDARNANFSFTAPSDTAQERVNKLLGRLKVRAYINRVGKQVMKNRPNTFVVLDKDDKGEVYIVTVYNKDIVAFEWEDIESGTLSYICYKHSKVLNESGKEVQLYAVYDSMSYRVISEDGTNVSLIKNNYHNLGACPAKPFIQTRLNTSNIFDRYNPFAPTLSSMATWTLFYIYSNFAEHYGVFPIVEKPKEACDNDDCEDGYISVALENGDMSRPEVCVSCANNKLMGAGTLYEYDPANYKDEQDVGGALRFVSPPTENLEFENGQQQRRESFIKKNTTGVDDNMSTEAVNADQVRAVMESRRKPLMFFSNEFSILDKWLTETAEKLQDSVDISVYSSYGTEWFLLSESDIIKLFNDSKIAGMPESELDELYSLLRETKYKSNPTKLERLVIENNLNPAPYSTIEECYKKNEKGVMTLETLAIKANFTRYIKRFERENIDLVEFGSDALQSGRLKFSQKIENIYSELIKYSKEDVSKNNEGEQLEL